MTFVTLARRLALAVLLVLATAPAAAQDQKRIALSFDDVPRFQGSFMTPDERTIALIAALKAAGVTQAAFFVTSGNLEQDYGKNGEARIRAYVDAGHVIANHSFSHTHLSDSTIADYIADLDKTETWLAGRAGRRPWYRFPYLDEGHDIERRDAVRAALKERGLANGYVTADFYDWAIDDLARKAIADKREIDLRKLGDFYAETAVQAADFYDRIARATLGRSPVHVMLMHETDLNALFLEDMVAALRADGWQIVPIDEAYRDPIAQSEPDTLVLGGGRVSALAVVAGRRPSEVFYERNDEAVLARLFEERVIVKGNR